MKLPDRWFQVGSDAGSCPRRLAQSAHKRPTPTEPHSEHNAQPILVHAPLKLTAEEEVAATKLRGALDSIMQRLRKHEPVKPEDINAIGALGHQLHTSLKERGHEPKHHKYMVKNRGLAPTDPAFYKHVHPAEDLLRFIGNEHANDDPVDVTIGHEFTFDVYCRRWEGPDSYRIKRTASGWIFSHLHLPAGRDGRVAGKKGTGLFHLLDHDSINYPEELPGYFEWLWEQAAERGLTHEQVQEAVGQLAQWVSTCERGSPTGVFEGYK